MASSSKPSVPPTPKSLEEGVSRLMVLFLIIDKCNISQERISYTAFKLKAKKEYQKICNAKRAEEVTALKVRKININIS